mmetsp:Transcript_4039/g.9766  ORF Transcript_4039/g.9766 Transcript_4039/m.9766 type:complete len:213 (-) Transcript_4039:1051-1689(-)
MAAMYVSRRAAKRSTSEAECIAPRVGATGVGGSDGILSRATPFRSTLARRGRIEASNASSDGRSRSSTAPAASGAAADPRPVACIIKRSFLSAASRAANAVPYDGAHSPPAATVASATTRMSTADVLWNVMRAVDTPGGNSRSTVRSTGKHATAVSTAAVTRDSVRNSELLWFSLAASNVFGITAVPSAAPAAAPPPKPAAVPAWLNAALLA